MIDPLFGRAIAVAFALLWLADGLAQAVGARESFVRHWATTACCRATLVPPAAQLIPVVEARAGSGLADGTGPGGCDR